MFLALLLRAPFPWPFALWRKHPLMGEEIQIRGDMLTKRIIKSGNGDHPPPGVSVKVHYVGTLMNGVRVHARAYSPSARVTDSGVHAQASNSIHRSAGANPSHSDSAQRR